MLKNPDQDDINKSLLAHALDPLLVAIDSELNNLVKNIDILEAVKPLNYQLEKKTFFESHFSVQPDFQYGQSTIDPFILKRNLFNLPIEQLKDEDLRTLYTDVVDSYVDKSDQLKSIGTGEFLYDSLRYYGEPDEKDYRNAKFILHIPSGTADEETALLDADAMKAILNQMIDEKGYSCELVMDEAMIANALVSGTRVRINRNAKLTTTDAMALAHHELGVHLVTSLNARLQTLKIFSVGMPLNTMTQEGLAILSEYLSGNLTIKRLKVLALRVLAVRSMMQDKNFRTTFLMLTEEYGADAEAAFTITARVYRGGGFCKDYLYLKGFRLMLNAYEKEANFNHLLVGKTSVVYLPIISRLIERGIVNEPNFISPAFENPQMNDAVNSFVAHAVR